MSPSAFFHQSEYACGVGEELVELGLVDAGLAAAVGFGAETGDDVGDDRLGGVIASRRRRE